MTFQQIIAKLNEYWTKQNCLLVQPYDIKMPAGTLHPATFFHALNPEPYRAAYVQPCRRPDDSYFGKHSQRLQQFYQYQVIIKPTPDNAIELYRQSILALDPCFDIDNIKLVDDTYEIDWLGALGQGYEMKLGELEITQFTSFDKMADLVYEPPLLEITYGLERLAMALQNKNHIFDIVWHEFEEQGINKKISYGELFWYNEYEQSLFNTRQINVAALNQTLEIYHNEIKRLIGLQAVIPAYEILVKIAHAVHLLDTKKSISKQRLKINHTLLKNYANSIAKLYLESLPKTVDLKLQKSYT